jgi:hypothetical protein
MISVPGRAESRSQRNELNCQALRRMAKQHNAKKVMEPYDWGIVAARTGISEDCNPYRPGTNEYGDWLAGFRDFAEEDDSFDIDWA